MARNHESIPEDGRLGYCFWRRTNFTDILKERIVQRREDASKAVLVQLDSLADFQIDHDHGVVVGRSGHLVAIMKLAVSVAKCDGRLPPETLVKRCNCAR